MTHTKKYKQIHISQYMHTSVLLYFGLLTAAFCWILQTKCRCIAERKRPPHQQTQDTTEHGPALRTGDHGELKILCSSPHTPSVHTHIEKHACACIYSSPQPFPSVPLQYCQNRIAVPKMFRSVRWKEHAMVRSRR